MVVGGIRKLTLLDYPGKTAATLFLAGCNLRCPFCHNAPLVLCPEGVEKIDTDSVFAFLKKRRGLLDGVCITGGEPTLTRVAGLPGDKTAQLSGQSRHQQDRRRCCAG